MAAPSAAAFLRKRKDKRPAISRVSTANAGTASAGPSTSSSPRPSQPSLPVPKSEPDAQVDQSHLVEIKLFSASSETLQKTRFNLMKLNYARDFDPTSLPRPILLNRKQPGPRAPPTFAFDAEGTIIGKLKYDEEGKPVLGADGQQVIEVKEKADLSLIGGSEQKKVRKKAIKEVYHQEKDVMRLRREEATPWILETGNPRNRDRDEDSMEVEGQTGGKLPEHWVGRYVDPHSLPTVLFVNDGQSEGFQIIPLGRTYKFEPERPFKVLDPDAAHKLYEHQMKHKIHDRWGQREGGRTGTHIVNPNQANGSGSGAAGQRVKLERGFDVRQDARARALEQRMRMQMGETRTVVKRERFDDDDRREGRGLGRGLEGGVDEELDYDEKDDFQDDDDVNTFHRDQEEEEEAKAVEERLKKEYRIANANVGDRPQIEDDLDDEVDLFGGKELTRDGRKLRKMMRKRRGSEDLFGDSEEDSESSDEEKPEDKKAREEKEKEKQKQLEIEKGKEGTGSTNPPGSADRPSRPPSRGPGVNRSDRGATSPGNSPRNMSPTPTRSGKSSTAPPVSGASFVAQRATSRGASPASRSRHASPRAASPDVSSGTRSPRACSPATGRAQSPSINTNAGSSFSREGTPSGSGSGSRPPISKPRNISAAPSTSTSGSPLPSPNPKRKPSPSPAGAIGDGPRKKKKGSNTPTPAPEDIEPFPGMITKEEIVAWFRTQKADRLPMNQVIQAFKARLVEPPTAELKDRNSKLFLGWVGQITIKGGDKTLQLKAEYQ